MPASTGNSQSGGGGYSDFFTSGFRAITSRPRIGRHSGLARNSIDIVNHNRHSFFDLGPQPTRRPASMMVRPAVATSAVSASAAQGSLSSSRFASASTSSGFSKENGVNGRHRHHHHHHHHEQYQQQLQQDQHVQRDTETRTRGARSSLASFFDRMISTPFDDRSSLSSSTHSKSAKSWRSWGSDRSRGRGGAGTATEARGGGGDSRSSVWINVDASPYTNGQVAPNHGGSMRSPVLHQPIDPFAPSPDSRTSFLIDLPHSSTTPHRESFLSLTGSSSKSSRRSSASSKRSSLSSLIFPPTHSPTRRERPNSLYPSPAHQISASRSSVIPAVSVVHSPAPVVPITLPIPPPSASSRSSNRSSMSSMQYPAPTVNSISEKSDFFFIVEEEPEELVYGPTALNAEADVNANANTVGHGPTRAAVVPVNGVDVYGEADAPATIDWRQFHIDVLTD